jgi:hypothetical protein
MEALKHHAPYLGFILLGASIYILSGIVKFQAKKKGRKWSASEWLKLNGFNTLLGLAASLGLYAITVTTITPLSYGACIALGMGLDLAANRLALVARK